MAQFDVLRTRDGGLVLDCQSDLLDDLNTRFVVPLAQSDGLSGTPTRLNPTLIVGGERWVMKTHFASSINIRDLKGVISSAEPDRYTILGALDFLLSGF